MSITMTRRELARCCVVALLAAFSASTGSQETGTALTLVCTGSGSVAGSQTTFVNTYDRKTKSHEYGTAQSLVRRPFSGSSNIEISMGTARIRTPSQMIPPIHSGSGGWFPIQGLFMNDREITGSLKFNGLNKPGIHIDRTTGVITISGPFSDYTGQCERVDAGSRPRF